MPVTQAMLMAAGLGTRLRPFTDFAPKALLPVLNVPIAQFAVDSLLLAGVDRIVTNVHHHAEATRRGLEALDFALRPSAELRVSDESRLLLGSAGGVRKALPHFAGKSFFLVNADVLSDIDLGALARTHEDLRRRHGVVLTLAVASSGPPGAKYAEILLDPREGLVRGIGPKAEGRPFFVSAAVFEAEALERVPDEVPAETVPLVFEPAIATGRAGYHAVTSGYGIWKDIGSPALWIDAHFEMMERLETGALPDSWRRRIESSVRRVAHGMWVAGGKSRPLVAARWSPRCFWDGVGQAPKELGPDAILYGAATSERLRCGIGYGGSWVQIAEF